MCFLLQKVIDAAPLDIHIMVEAVGMAIVKCLIVGILLMLEIDRTTQGQLVRLGENL